MWRTITWLFDATYVNNQNERVKENNMSDEKTKDTYIKDSKVEIVINSGASVPNSNMGKKTDYAPMIIASVIVLGVAAYFFLKRIGIL